MTMSTSRYQLDAQAARAAGAVQRGAELRLPCPAHDSSPETLALRQGRVGPIWHCHAGCHPCHVPTLSYGRKWCTGELSRAACLC